MEVISWKNMPIFTEIIFLMITENTLPYGQRFYCLNKISVTKTTIFFCMLICAECAKIVLK